MNGQFTDFLSLLTPLGPYLNMNKYYPRGQQGGAMDYQSGNLIGLLLAIWAAYLAWNCSAMETTTMRVIYTIIAFLFGGLYLIYYFVYRFLMGNPCF